MKEGDKTALTEKNILMENYFQGSPPPGTYSSDGPRAGKAVAQGEVRGTELGA
uniref:Uncharacterized protein n=1 Tax=Anguilla anguilla TaxID=7936 RepID=A0A0E9VG02_ANGAN